MELLTDKDRWKPQGIQAAPRCRESDLGLLQEWKVRPATSSGPGLSSAAPTMLWKLGWG